MVLGRLLRATRTSIDWTTEVIHTTRIRRGDDAARRIEFSALEERLLLSAAPAAMVQAAAPAPAEDQPDAAPPDAAQQSPDLFTDIDANTPAAADAEAAQQVSKELVLIDADVADVEQLLADLEANGDTSQRELDYVVLDPTRDGLEQVTEALARYSTDKLDAVHFVTHGTDRAIKLGGTWLDAAALAENRALVESWSFALNARADLMFYGCELAGHEAGRSLLQSLADATGADVAASDDDTGHRDYGADWDLEYTRGDVESDVAFSQTIGADWRGVLATFTVTSTADTNTSGTLRWAINQANALAGLDTITFSIGGAGVQTINLTSALPTITDAVFINGYSQTGSSQNSLAVGNNAVLLIELNGASVGGDGLVLGAGSGGSTIQGLIINRFGDDGIEILSNGNVVAGNWIGLNNTGASDLGNANDGLDISGDNNLIGGATPQARNVISGNDDEGLDIDAAATGTLVRGNYIGTNAAGSAAVANGQSSVALSGGIVNEGTGNTIGGSSAGEGNLISGNHNFGVNLYAGNATVLGNWIGTNALGTATIGTQAEGVIITTSGNVIGSTLAGGRNVISGNTLYGVRLEGSSALSNQLHGNYIGLNAAGTGMLGNGNDGVYIVNGASNNTVGGATTAHRNVIAGNSDGVQLGGASGGANNNIVRNNYIGTNAAGTVDFGNVDDGVDIDNGANNNQVLDNLIAGSTGDGIDLGDAGTTTGTIIRGNVIGLASDGTTPLGNSGHGIVIGNGGTVNSTSIGGTTAGQGNTIANNAGDGIYVITGSGISILGNSIYGNTGLGIDLGTDAVTANDPGDGDGGANNQMNFPVIYSVSISGGNVTITGEARPGATVEFFESPDAAGTNGEGQTFLGRGTVTGLVAGSVDSSARQFSFVFAAGSLVNGDRVTATATDASNNTSEFGVNVAAVTAAGITVTPVSGLTTTEAGGTATFSVVLDTQPGGTFGPAGTETRVNTTTTNNQFTQPEQSQAVAMDAAGNYVVVWVGNGTGDADGVFARRFLANGTPQGSEFLVNTSTSGTQEEAAVSMDDAGNFVIVWAGNGTQAGNIDSAGVFGQRFLADGTRVGGEFLVNTTTSGTQEEVAVALDADGDFVVTWNGNGNQAGNVDSAGVFMQRFAANGTRLGSETLVNVTTSGTQEDSSVAREDNGDFVVIWNGNGTQSGNVDATGVFFRRFNAAGTALSNETLANVTTSNTQHYSSVAMDADGDFVVVWMHGLDGGNSEVYARRFDNTGAAAGSEFQVNTTASLDQYYSSVGMSADGAFTVAWTSWGQDSGGDCGIFAQRYTSSGVATGAEFQVSTSTSGDQFYPSVAMDADGDFVVVWSGNGTVQSDSSGVFAQRYTGGNATVTIGLSSSDLTEGTLSVSSLTFNSSNWNIPQIVTITGVNDAPADGNVAYTIITAAATSSDSNYNGLNAADVAVMNADDDIYSLSGTVYEDVDGDGLISDDGVGLAGAAVSLYLDDGDAVLDAGDAIVNSILANGNGQYTFNGLSNAMYWVVVDSRTFIASAGLRGGYTIHDQWAEQTYGSTGSVAWNGSGYTFTGAAGSFFGGMRQDRGDNGASLLTAEHVTRVLVAAANVSGIDTGFSYNVVTNTRDGDEVAANNRTIQGSLRQFLQNGNAIDSVQSSNFQIGGGGSQSIAVAAGGLPTIDDDLILDATTQEGFSGAPLIELNGTSAGAGVDGLFINSGSATIRGLAIGYFNGDGIVMTMGGGNTVAGNYIALNTGAGVFVSAGSAGNLIGGAAAADRNTISANGGSGVVLSSAGGNTIRGNYIGTNQFGTGDFGNGVYGVELFDSASNAVQDNVISGNDSYGVLMWGEAADNNVLAGNYIGVDAAGTAAIGNSLDGIFIGSGADLATIGGVIAAQRNVISGNGGDGIEINDAGTTGHFIMGNYIGLNAAGNAALANGRYGVVLYNGVSDVAIGGAFAGAGNVISGNTNRGIMIDANANAATTNFAVQGNLIGLNAAGTTAIGNGGDGIMLFNGVTNATIGGTTANERNVISGNTGNGIHLTSAGTSGNFVFGNYIGTDVTGLLDRGNLQSGINIDNGATNTTIGGTTAGHRNVISGNAGQGIYISDVGTQNNTIAGNYIGLGADGDTAIGNDGQGVMITNSAANNTIGGLTAASRNVISGNVGFGVYIGGGGTGNVVLSNYIGTNAAGTAARANIDGVYVENVNGAVVGQAGAGNLISGNTYFGVLVDAGAVNTSIQANLIGTDAAGTAALGNLADGVLIRNGATGTIVGGTTAAVRNIISGNAGQGISIEDAATTGTIVRGNYIGTDITGELDVGNAGNGIDVTAPNSTIGGTGAGEGNIISGNDLRGVFVTGAATTAVLIAGNRIGTDDDGQQALGNTFDGIEVNFGAGGVTVQNNVVAANGQYAIISIGAGGANTFTGNTVGLNVAQSAVLGGRGIGLFNSGHTVTGNTIGGSATYGLFLSNSANNTIQGNHIGTNAAYATGLGNAWQGIGITGSGSTGNLIGGTDWSDRNVIEYSGLDGIALDSSAGSANSILGNSICTNGSTAGDLAIDLIDNGVTLNDYSASPPSPQHDADSGPNDLQNFPVILSAVLSGTSVSVDGTLSSAPSSQYRIELFRVVAGNDDPSGHGESCEYLGSVTVTTDAAGYATFSVVFDPVTFAVGDFVSATATAIVAPAQVGVNDLLAYGSTSEMAQNVVASVAGPAQSLPGPQSVVEDGTLTFSTGGGNSITVDDGTASTSIPLQVRLTATNGTFTLGGTVGITFVSGANGTAGMVFWGAEADINTALQNAYYTPTGDYNGPAAISVETALAASLNGYYQFSSLGTIGVDASYGTAQNGTALGDATVVTDGTRGNVLSLDGNGDAIQVSGLFGSPANVTIGGWVNLSALATGRSEFISLDDRVHIALDDFNGVKGSIQIGASSWTDLHSNQFIAGTGWHHVMYVFDDMNNVHTLYIDGNQVATAANPDAIYYTGATTTYIGRHPAATPANDLEGQVDDVRIYTRALSASEVFAIASDTHTASGTIGVTVTPVNDAPAVTTSGGSVQYNENAVPVVIDSGLTVGDIDSPTLSGATVRISANYVNGQDVLSFTNQLGITGSWSAATGTLTLSGSAALADYQTALRTVTYHNTSENPSVAIRTVEFVVNDGAANSTGATRDVQVVSWNDAATTNPASANGLEDATSIAITLSGSDVDGTVDRFRLNSLPANGTLYLDSGLTTVAAASVNYSATAQALTLYFVPNADWNGVTTFQYIARSNDGGPDSIAATATITVTAVNDAPAITSNGGSATAGVSLPENMTAVTTVAATDIDLPAQTLTYTITGGLDQGLFTIGGSNGVLTFLGAPDYELPSDSNGDNIYEVIVQVSDGNGGTDTQAIAVTVTPVNDNAPVITSNGGGASAAVTVSENSTSVTSVAATDADLPSQTLTYSISGGLDAGLFAIDGVTGALSFLAAPDYELPGDNGGDNVYDVQVTVSDGSGGTDVQDIAVSVTPVNESAPVITSDGGSAAAAMSLAENSADVTTVTASDADAPAPALVYSILPGADAARFSIDTATGALRFVVPPDFETPTDVGLDNVYNVTVQVSDGTLIDTQSIAVTVTNAAETPASYGDAAIWRSSGDSSPNAAEWNGTNFSAAQNTASVGQWRIIDGAESPTRDEKIVLGVNASGVISGEIYSGGVWTALPFSMATVAGSTNHGFDVVYESQSGDAIVVWNNNTTGTNSVSYRVWNGSSWSAQQTVTVPNAGRAQELQLASNPTRDELILIVCPQNEIIDYAVVWNGSSWGNAITLDSTVGLDRTEVGVAFESQSGQALVVYDADAWTSDLAYRTWNGSSWSAQSVLNAPAGVGAGSDASWTVLASDPTSDRIAFGAASDGNETWFKMWDGSSWDAGVTATTNSATLATRGFSIAFEALTGEALAVYGEAGQNSVSYRTWSSGGGWSAEQTGPNLGAVPNAITLSADVDSNRLMLAVQDANSDLRMVQWNGAAWGTTHTLDTNTGETAVQPFLFLYDASVNTPPAITSNGGGATANVSLPENTAAVTTVTSTDADLPAQTLTYTITGGLDQGLFTIGSSNGVLAFLGAPDYELPGDSNGDNVYEVIVQVSDGNGSTDTQLISVTVTNANESPTVTTIANQTINEDGSTGALAFTVGDPETAAGLLTVTASSSNTTLIPNANLVLGGSGANRTITVTPAANLSGGPVTITVTVSDGVNSTQTTFTVTVTAVNDAPVVTTTGTTLNYRENAVATPVDPGLAITDGDNGTLTGATVTISFSYVNGQDVLAFTDQLGITGSWSAATGVLTLSGTATLADYQTALRSVTYFNSSDNPGTSTRTISFVVNDGAAGSAAATRNVSVTAVNDAPVLDNTGAMTLAAITEDQTSNGGDAVFTIVGSAGGDRITDPDATLFEGIAITGLAGGNGTWQYSITGGASWNNIVGVSDASALLLRETDRLRFVPNGVDGTSASVTFRAWDQSSGAAGTQVDASQNGTIYPFSAATETATITVTAVNDAPTATIAPASYNATEQTTLTLHGTGLSIADIDAGAAAVQATVSVTSGTLNATAGATGVAVSGSGTSTVTLSGTLAQINDLLAGNLSATLTFFHSSDAPPASTTVTLIASDLGNTGSGGTLSGNDAATINIAAVNDAPTVAGMEGVALAYAENSGPVAITSTLTIADVDDVNIESAQVRITGGYVSGEDVLAFANTLNITGTWNAGTGTLILTGSDTPANYEAALRSVTYENLSDSPTTTLRIVAFSVHDGDVASSSATRDIAIGAVNDAPAITVNVLTISEGGTVVLSTANVNSSDPDNTPAQLTYTVTGLTGGQFQLVADGSVVTTFTQAQINAGAIRFVHDGGEAAPAYSLTVSDGALSNGPQAATITFSNVNDAPAITANALTISEGGTVVLSAANAGTSDPDNTPAQLTYTVTGLTGGQFQLVADGSVVTTFTQAQINAGAIRFVHDGGEFVPAYNLTVSDGALSNGPNAATVTFSNVNDAPAININALTISEGGTVVLSAANAGSSDPDNTPAQLTYTVTGLTGGQFQLVADGSVVTTFTQAQIDAGAIRFVHDGGESAPAYNLTVSDGALSNGPNAATVTFSNVNDAPAITANALTISEGGTVALSAANAGTSDPDNTPAQLTYTVTGLTGGQFQLVADGSVVTTFTQAQINAGAIRFVHDGGESAPAYSLTVSDGALSHGPQGATITFTNVNDAPVASAGGPYVIVEGAGLTLDASATTDVDGGAPSYAWDLDNDGQFDDAVGVGPTLTWAQLQALGIDDNGTYTLSVQVDDGAGGVSTAATTLTVTNTPPTANDDSGVGFVSGEDGGFTTGSVLANDSDPAAGDALTVVSVNTLGTRGLVINNGDGTFTYNPNGQFETLASGEIATDTFSYTISDGDGGFSTATVTITITGANDAPALADAAFTIAENSPNGTAVGSVTAVDVDASDSHTYSIIAGNTGGAFTIDAATGTITVADASLLDFDTQATFTLTVLSSDSGSPGLSDTATVTINVTDVNDAAPIVTPGQTFTIDENSAAGRKLGMLTATDVDTGGTLQDWQIVGGTGAGAFIINPTTGLLCVSDPLLLDFESLPTLTLLVQVSDGINVSAAETVTIQLRDLNDTRPVVAPGQTFSVRENSPQGMSLGAATATDRDTVGAIQNWQIVGGDGAGVFQIDAVTGEITVLDSSRLNFERQQSVTLQLTVSDGVSDSLPETVLISVTNVNEAPQLQMPATATVDANGVQSDAPGLLAGAHDPEGDALALQLVDGTTFGTVTVHADGSWTYMPHGGHMGPDRFTIAATDGSLSSPPVVVWLNVHSGAPVPIPTPTPTQPHPPSSHTDSADPAEPVSPPAAGGGSPLPAMMGTAQGRVARSLPAGDSEIASGTAPAADSPSPMAWLDARKAQHEASYRTFRAAGLEALRTTLSGLGVETSEDLAELRPVLMLAPGGMMWNALDGLAADLDEQLFRTLSFERLVVGSSAVTATGLSVGYVIWLLRGGSLVLTMATALPTWMSFDPLPILGLACRRDDESDDGESLLQMIQSRSRKRSAAAGRRDTSHRP